MRGAEWIEIVPEKDEIPNAPFLLSNEYGNVYVGFTAFDYYDAKYWFPMPKYPLSKPTITNDLCVSLLMKTISENID